MKTSRARLATDTRLNTQEIPGAHVEGQGPAVVLLHGSMSSKKQWAELVQGMRGSYRLIALDLHGYGSAPPPPVDGHFSVSDEVRLVEGVLASTLSADEGFHLVGHSYGGVVALQLAQGKPGRVRSLSLYEPIPYPVLPAHNAAVADMLTVHQQIEADLRNGDARGGTAAFVDYWSGRGAFSRMTEERRHALCEMLPKAVLEIHAVATQVLTAERYKQIIAPVCLIAGRESPRAAQIATEVLASLLPHARQMQVDAGHLAPATHPHLVNPVIECFIRGVERELHDSFKCDSSNRAA